MAKIKQKLRDRKTDIDVEKERLKETRLKMISKLKKDILRKDQIRRELQESEESYKIAGRQKSTPKRLRR